MENRKNIYEMINEFRAWDRAWENYDNFLINKPKSIGDFINDLAKRYDVTTKQLK